MILRSAKKSESTSNHASLFAGRKPFLSHEELDRRLDLARKASGEICGKAGMQTLEVRLGGKTKVPHYRNGVVYLGDEGHFSIYSDRELRAIIGHEIGHKYLDESRIGLPNAMERMLTRNLEIMERNVDSLPKGIFGALRGAAFVFRQIVALHFAIFIKAIALRKAGEYLADSFSARMTGDPSALISALQKKVPWAGINRILPGFLDIFHPSTKKRIERLKIIDERMGKAADKTLLHQP